MKLTRCARCGRPDAIWSLHRLCPACFDAKPLRPEDTELTTDEAAAWARNLAQLRPEWSQERIHAALFPDPMTLAEELS